MKKSMLAILTIIGLLWTSLSLALTVIITNNSQNDITEIDFPQNVIYGPFPKGQTVTLPSDLSARFAGWGRRLIYKGDGITMQDGAGTDFYSNATVHITVTTFDKFYLFVDTDTSDREGSS